MQHLGSLNNNLYKGWVKMEQLIKNQSKVRCPVHGSVIGKYDIRVGLTNATFYCPKCKLEYTYTIPAQKPREIKEIR